jgi:kumamolisin
MLTKSTSLVAPYRHPQEKRLSTRRGAVESHLTRVSESTRVAHLRSWRSIKHSTRLLTTLPANRQCGNCRSAWDLGASFMSPAEVKTEHTKFLHLAAAAINVFVSSGDAGSNPDTGHNPTRPLQAEYQASDPAVIGAGGSSLRLDATVRVSSEQDGLQAAVGEADFSLARLGKLGRRSGRYQRLVPDVCAAADPNAGALLVFGGRTIGLGGTSWSAPVWAGFCALINEARQRSGKAPWGFSIPDCTS